MGIQGLIPFLKKSSRPVNLSEFKGKTAAVDVYCWLHKGAFSCAEKLVKGEPTDAYVVYVMKQVNMLLSYNIKPILVFDGCHLPAKGITESKRRESRIKNRRKAKELLREGKTKEAKECFQRCVDITSTMAHETIKACRARNIDTIVAPYEADSQLAYLSQAGIADIIITEDSDLILFGCDKIIFKIDYNGGGMLVEKEKLHLSMNLPRDKFDFNKFRNMCILSGCDYLPSLHGIGLVKACRFFIVTSNPDVFTALCKLPINLKMPHLEVTLEYRQSFMKAINTLLYQLVFDPVTRTLRPLTPYPPGTDHEDMPYSGAFLGHERAYQIALGNVDVQTGETVDNYDPATSEKPEMKSSGWNQKGDLVSNHPSIWDPDYATLIKSWSNVEKEKGESGMRGKKFVVDVSALKRKRIVSETPDKDEISEEFLESVYSSNSKKLKFTEKEDEDKKIKEEYSPKSSDTKEEVNTLCDSDMNSEIKEESPTSPQKTDTLSSDKDTRPNSCTKSMTDDSIFAQFDKSDEAMTTPSRNPFAKKIVNFSNSENINPMKAGKFSALKRFSTPVIVRSRYFKTDEDLSIEKEPIINTVLKSPASSKTELIPEENNDCESPKADQNSPIRSPLKCKNESVFDTPPNETPKRIAQTSSFNWGRKSLSQKFSFTSKEKLSPAVKSQPFKEDFTISTKSSAPNITLETPPSSQNEFGETSQEIDSSFNEPRTDSNLETKHLESGSDGGTSSCLTPVEEDKKKDFPKPLNRCLKTKSPHAPKCRVSGLKKPSPTAGKQKQLNLKDMFAFKKDVKKIVSMST